jgi:L-cysteine:1D-myo-inositol 2-amino-2-deoxy-alpha-D-glucopyranoside ligase
MAIRWALMKNHYRTDRMWTDELLVTSEKEMVALRSAVSQNDVAPTKELIERIVTFLADDLDTHSVIEAINAWVQLTRSGDTGGEADSLAKALDTLLGIKL